MHDGVDRDGGQQPGEGVTVGEVAGGPRRFGAERREFGLQVRGARGVRAPAADEQQPAYAVSGHQVTGEGFAQRAGGAGEQHGAEAEGRALGEGGGRFVRRAGGRVLHRRGGCAG